MPSKRSLDYWAKRRAREMYEELIPVEEAAEEMRLLYFEASKDVEAEAMKLTRKFQLKHNLSEAEAHRLLNQLSSAEDLAHLWQLLKANPDNADVAAQLESQAYAARIRRLIELQSSVDAAAASVFEQVANMFPDVLEQIATRTYYEQIFGTQQRAGFGFMFNPLDQDRLQRVLQQRWGGDNFSKKLWEERLEVNTQKLANKVKKEIMLNLLTGKTPHQMATAIQKEFGVGATETRRLIRTEATYVSGQIQLEAYKEMGIEKYIYVAILDLRTSLICRSLDKKRFLVKNAMPGDNYPPMHPWCRSTTIAWMPDELLKRLEQRALDPVTGQRVMVPGDMTYEEWERQFAKSKQLSGQSRARLSSPISKFDLDVMGSENEKAVIYTKEGELVFSKEGSPTEIVFTPEEVELMRGNIVTHTHTSGGTLSDDDFKTLFASGALEIRAVTDKGVYYIKQPERWPEQFISDDDIIKAWWNEFSDAAEQANAEAYQGKFGRSRKQYLLRRGELATEQFCRKYGIEYGFEAF